MKQPFITIITDLDSLIMPTATKRCVNCKQRKRNEEMIQPPNKQWFCDRKCITQYSTKRFQTNKIRAQKASDKEKRKELDSRSRWYTKLQILVNQYIVKVRDAGKPCYTCGKTDENVKYDAGHRYHAGRGGGDRRRFVLENIHKQCSVNCNQHGGGMPVEYDIALDKEYGKDFADTLSFVGDYPTLKEQFPTWQDIESEINRYRKVLRANGIKPNI
jgi:hypothetical protein